jgi:hypothetical protein
MRFQEEAFLGPLQQVIFRPPRLLEIAAVQKHFQERAFPIRCASIEMTKGRARSTKEWLLNGDDKGESSSPEENSCYSNPVQIMDGASPSPRRALMNGSSFRLGDC